MAIDFARMVMSYHPTILVNFSRVVLAGAFFFLADGQQARDGIRMALNRETEVWDGILGLTIVNDVTARDFQREDGVFTRGKGFNTFCPMGPWILLGDESLDES